MNREFEDLGFQKCRQKCNSSFPDQIGRRMRWRYFSASRSYVLGTAVGILTDAGGRRYAHIDEMLDNLQSCIRERFNYFSKANRRSFD